MVTKDDMTRVDSNMMQPSISSIDPADRTLINMEDVANAQGQESQPTPEASATTFRQILRDKYQVEFTHPKDIEERMCAPVTEEDLEELVPLTKKMLNILTDLRGAGLAGPQVGSYKRFFVWWQGQEPRTTYNPEYYPEGSPTFTRESCLTYGKDIYKVKRFKRIRAVWYENDNGKLVKRFAQMGGGDAIVFQHETDHTKGITIAMKGELIVVVK
jgi:peptide deformylase